jgi:hypothetical protein
MADMNNPSGMRGSNYYKGYSDLSEGVTELTITNPEWDGLSYVPYIVPSWNTSWGIISFLVNQFTVTFSTPAPSGGRVRWVIFS